MDFLELASNRYSERFFDPRPVEQEKLDRIRGFDSKTVVDTFGLPEHMIPVMMLGLGYPNERAKANAWHYKRNPIEDFVTEL